jgi:hypothetical protein
MTNQWWERPCWHCGTHPVSLAMMWFEGKYDSRVCCGKYLRCKSLKNKAKPDICDICNRDHIPTHMITYPDLKNHSIFATDASQKLRHFELLVLSLRILVVTFVQLICF